MTTTMNRVNGRPRSTLADQIDRLDGILDGLSDALTQAVADAVKEAVKAAVADLARRPDLLRPVVDTQPSPAGPTWRDRLRRVARRATALVHDALTWAAQMVRGAGGWVRSTVGPIRVRARSTGGRAVVMPIAEGNWTGSEDCWRRHRPAVLAVAMVLLAGVAWALVGPFAACLACGVLAVAIALGAGKGLTGRNRPEGRWPESPGECVPQLSGGGPDYWI